MTTAQQARESLRAVFVKHVGERVGEQMMNFTEPDHILLKSGSVFEDCRRAYANAYLEYLHRLCNNALENFSERHMPALKPLAEELRAIAEGEQQ